MRKVALYVFLIFLMASVIGSCHQSHKKELDDAYVLAESNPDSAIAYLNHIDKKNMSEEDMAKYALVYYMAQDKSGLDVDNDSLIRVAYNWYEKHQEDSLYAKSLYYMGEYYRLADSIVQAKKNFERVYKEANRMNDVNLVALSLDKLAQIEGYLNPKKAVKMARKLVCIYEQFPKMSAKNRIYAMLRLGTNLMFVDSLEEALCVNMEALNNAKILKDKDVEADVCQDMSCVYDELGKKDSSLFYAKKASSLKAPTDISCQLALATIYYNVDSIPQMFNVLNSLAPKLVGDKYSIFYLKTMGAIKNKDVASATNYCDSANACMERMYHEAIQGKYKYYSSVLQQEKEKSELKGKSEMQRWIFGISVSLLVSLLMFLLYAYISNKKRAHLKILYERKLSESKLAHEKEIHEQEKQMAYKLHKEELAHKEIQLSVMRNFLLKKIEIAEKLNSIEKKDIKHVVLSENDWAELEAFLESVEDLFVTRLKKKHPNLSQADVRLMMLLRFGLSQKALSSIYCISEKAIKQKLFLYKEKVGIQAEHFSLRKYIEMF